MRNARHLGRSVGLENFERKVVEFGFWLVICGLWVLHAFHSGSGRRKCLIIFGE